MQQVWRNFINLIFTCTLNKIKNVSLFLHKAFFGKPGFSMRLNEFLLPISCVSLSVAHYPQQPEIGA